MKDHLNKLYDDLGAIAQNKLSKNKHNFIHLAFGEDNPMKMYSAIKLPLQAISLKQH